MAVVIDDHQMAHVECGEKSPGSESTKGWGCLFLPMPHLCTFDTAVVRLGRGSSAGFGVSPRLPDAWVEVDLVAFGSLPSVLPDDGQFLVFYLLCQDDGRSGLQRFGPCQGVA